MKRNNALLHGMPLDFGGTVVNAIADRSTRTFRPGFNLEQRYKARIWV